MGSAAPLAASIVSRRKSRAAATSLIMMIWPATTASTRSIVSARATAVAANRHAVTVERLPRYPGPGECKPANGRVASGEEALAGRQLIIVGEPGREADARVAGEHNAIGPADGPEDLRGEERLGEADFGRDRLRRNLCVHAGVRAGGRVDGIVAGIADE